MDPATLRRLWLFRPQYRLLYMARRGDECIVGTSDRSAAWILARHSDMDNGRIFEHAGILRGLGFDPRRLRLVRDS